VEDLSSARRRYAQLVSERGSVGSSRPFSERLFTALAEVPRERHLGPGPWKISRLPDPWTKIETPDDDAEHLYDDVLVSIVPERGLANGLPSAHARWVNALDLEPGDSVLHCGCGTGYYTAIIANVVGDSGRVTAIELDRLLASRAVEALRHLSNVAVVAGDATIYNAGKVDAIYVNAGATYPPPLWLDGLKPGGRLIFPMVRYPRGGESWVANAGTGKRDFETGMGLMLRIQRTARGYSSAVVSPTVFFPCFGAIDVDPGADRVLAEALRSGAIAKATSLRREPHDRDASCMVHAQRYCFSKLVAR
jgi:protein-L-isoaspartate(D-aspartate) O-methyltransferase